MGRLEVRLGELNLKNPVIITSGCFGYGEELRDFFDPSSIGAFTTKTVTLKGKFGNKPIRIAETPSGVLNSIGLENVGVEKFISEKLPICSCLGTKLIVSVGGADEKEYINVAEIISRENGVDAIELNISCPNVEKGGVEIGLEPDRVKKLVKKVKNKIDKFLIVKLSPVVTDIVEIASAAVTGGCDILMIGNTYKGMAIDIKTRKPLLGMKHGGLSGPAIKPLSLYNVYKVYEKFSEVPIIGCGGIFRWEDALEYIFAGASAIGIGTANLINPTISLEIIKGLENYLIENKITEIKELVGCAVRD